MTSGDLPLSVAAVTPSVGGVQMVRYDLPLVRPCWLPQTCMCVAIVSIRICSMTFPGTEVNVTGVVKQVFLPPPFFKNRIHLSFFPVSGILTWAPWIFKYHREWLGNNISQFLQDPEIHLERTHRYICGYWVSSGGSEPALPLQWEELCSSTPTSSFKDLRHLRSQTDSRHQGGEITDYLHLLCVCYPFFLLFYWLGTLSLACIFWLMDLRTSHYSSYAFSIHVPFHLSLSFPDPSPTHLNLIPIFFPGNMFLLPLAVHSLLTSQCEEQVFPQPCNFLTCLTWFPTHWGGKTCTLKDLL